MTAIANLDFTDQIKLEDERVLLRPLERSDYDNLLPFSMNEPEIWKYSLIHAIGEAGLKNYIEIAMNARSAKTEFPFIVYDKKLERYAGSTRYYDIQLSNKSLQLGYTWYGKQFQGTGLNKHCKYLLLAFAFEKMGMERVEFRADNNNARSIAAMKSIGCIVEGVLRSNSIKSDGGRRDSIVLSILKTEWEQTVKDNLVRQIERYKNHMNKESISSDREIVTTRIVNAPNEIVFKAWTEPDHLINWWGPKGFTNTFHEFDLKPGGIWRFTMHGPERGNFQNEVRFVTIIQNEFISWDRISQPLFKIETSFEEQPNNQTKVIFKMIFGTVEECEKLKKYVVDKNEENMDKLEDELTEMMKNENSL